MKDIPVYEIHSLSINIGFLGLDCVAKEINYRHHSVVSDSSKTFFAIPFPLSGFTENQDVLIYLLFTASRLGKYPPLASE